MSCQGRDQLRKSPDLATCFVVPIRRDRQNGSLGYERVHHNRRQAKEPILQCGGEDRNHGAVVLEVQEPVDIALKAAVGAVLANPSTVEIVH